MAEGVFAVGVSGMGPALSPEGERIVNAKMEARDRLLDNMEKKGLNVDVLAHRHRRGCSHDEEHECENEKRDIAGFDEDCEDLCNACIKEEDALPLARSCQEALRAVWSRVRLQEGELDHLRHRIAVQDNQILLLREALETMRNGESFAGKSEGGQHI